MLDNTATIEQLQEQQRQLTQTLKEAWDREVAELTDRAAKLGLALVAQPTGKKRGRKPRAQQEQM